MLLKGGHPGGGRSLHHVEAGEGDPLSISIVGVKIELDRVELLDGFIIRTIKVLGSANMEFGGAGLGGHCYMKR